MSTARKIQPISVADYLAGELTAKVKHEYLAGAVYAMSGGTNAHNLIASNCLGALFSRLRGKPCRAYNSDTKIRIRLQSHDRFYYPDVSVICRPNAPSDSFQDDPAVIVEVLSRKTRRIDEGEKKDAYLSISRLSAYVLLEQDTAAAVVYRRSTEGFTREIYTGLAATIQLEAVGVELPFAEVYDAVEFIAEPETDD